MSEALIFPARDEMPSGYGGGRKRQFMTSPHSSGLFASPSWCMGCELWQRGISHRLHSHLAFTVEYRTGGISKVLWTTKGPNGERGGFAVPGSLLECQFHENLDLMRPTGTGLLVKAESVQALHSSPLAVLPSARTDGYSGMSSLGHVSFRTGESSDFRCEGG